MGDPAPEYGDPMPEFSDLVATVQANHQLRIENVHVRLLNVTQNQAICTCGKVLGWTTRQPDHLLHVMWIAAQSWKYDPPGLSSGSEGP